MKKSNKALAPMKLYCQLFGHNYEVSKKVTSHVKEYTCSCCKKQLTTDSNGDLTELTPVFEEINSILEQMYMHRSLRSQEKAFSTSGYHY